MGYYEIKWRKLWVWRRIFKSFRTNAAGWFGIRIYMLSGIWRRVIWKSVATFQCSSSSSLSSSSSSHSHRREWTVWTLQDVRQVKCLGEKCLEMIARDNVHCPQTNSRDCHWVSYKTDVLSRWATVWLLTDSVVRRSLVCWYLSSTVTGILNLVSGSLTWAVHS
jgi:hypothetical protein